MHLIYRAMIGAILLCALCLAPISSSANHLTFRGDYNYPPYEYLDNGIPSGFNIDILRAVAKAMDIDIKIDLGPWSEVRSQLENGDIDALTGMYESPERDLLVDFSTPHIIVSHAIFVRKGSPISSEDDLKGKSILVQRGDIMHDYALDNFPDSKVIPVESQVNALNMLAGGEDYDCALLGKLQNLFWAQKKGLDNIITVGGSIEPGKYCFAVREGDEGLLTQLNEGLAIIKNSGEYDRIFNKWFGVYERKSVYREAMGYISMVLGPLIILLLGFVFWSWLLRKKVRQRTAQLRAELVERHKAEKALKVSEARYKSIFNNMMDGYYNTDTEGNLIMVNPSAVRMLKYNSLEDLLGINVGRDLYVDPGLRDEFNRQVLEKGYSKGFQADLYCKDGSVVTVEANSHLMRDPVTGEPVGVEGVFRDITDRKRMEEVMVQTEKMMSLGGMAAGMAHEINNPLAAMLGSVQNIRSRLFDDTPKNIDIAEKCGVSLTKIREYLEGRGIPRMLDIINESGTRAARIVSNMLSFSRKSEKHFAQNDLVEIMENTIELASNDYDLKKKYDFKGIEIIRDYDDSLPSVYCERNEIQQVFLNLLRNGAEAMFDKEYEDGGPGFKVSIRKKGDKALVVIEDNGPGMDRETRKRIFEPFFTSKSVSEGTGLGLSISYFIVTEQHKGSLEVESVQGDYTRFTVSLPLGGNYKD